MNLCICGKEVKSSNMAIWICGRLRDIHNNEECMNQAYEYWQSEGSRERG